MLGSYMSFNWIASPASKNWEPLTSRRITITHTNCAKFVLMCLCTNIHKHFPSQGDNNNAHAQDTCHVLRRICWLGLEDINNINKNDSPPVVVDPKNEEELFIE